MARSLGARRLEEWRRRRGVVHARAAELLGISQSYYSYLERDEKKPARGLAVRIARVTAGTVSVESWDDYTRRRAVRIREAGVM